MYCRNSICDENLKLKLKLCTCAQSHALGTRTKFQLEILTVNVISGVVYFREIILESSQNISETTPWVLMQYKDISGLEQDCSNFSLLAMELRQSCTKPSIQFHQYRKSHCRGKTVIRSSYLHSGNSYTGKTTSLY